ncbi:MAG: WYL domain-containing protein, partial [Synechococcus sp.]|nr:WYL domain-containing protein [Synechococcus sp.]
MSRQLERLLEIDRLLRSPEKQTQVRIAEVLEVSERTVRNDINFLRDRFDAPLEYTKGKGWHYTNSSWRLPSIPITQGELFALTLGARMLQSYSGSVFQGMLQSAIARLAERLPAKVMFDLQQLANERVHFRAGGEIQVNPEIWMRLIEASERSQSVLMRYYSPKSQQESKRQFDPYDLDIYRASNPYVWGYCHLRKEIRQFRIDRIRELEILEQTFERRPFNLQEKLGTSFQYEVGGTTYDVAIA